jgi:hypothetical protein
LIAVCLGVGWGIAARHRQSNALKKEKEEFIAKLSASGNAQPTSASTRQESGPPEVSSEPLCLASEMRRVVNRERELAGTPEENERFWAQAGPRLASLPEPPPDFIRKSEAQWVGTSSPENTFQSALWALHQRRLDAFLQLLAPETAETFQQQIGNSPEKFLDEAARISAMRLSDQKFFGAATIRAELDLGPDDRETRTIFFFLLDGQWKINLDDAWARFTR